MWWAPESSHEETLKADVGRIAGWYVERRSSYEVGGFAIGGDDISSIWGFGSAWSPWFGQMVPVLAIKPDSFVLAEWWRRRRSSGWYYSIPLDFFGIHIPVETTLPLHVLASFPPRPSNISLDAARAVIKDLIHVKAAIGSNNSPRIGSAGVMVKTSLGEHRLLTAGHVIPGGKGTIVEKVRWPVLRRLSPRSRYGTVSHHNVPNKGTAGWDVAVIEPDQSLHPKRTIFTRCVRRLARPERIFARGAISGFVSRAAALHGALVEGRGGGYRWKNCWMVSPTGVLGPGDSGSAVFRARDGSLLGVYVGAEGFPGEAPLCHYVQDAWSIEVEQLRAWNMAFA